MTASIYTEYTFLYDLLCNDWTWEPEAEVSSGSKEGQGSEMWRILRHTQKNLCSWLLTTKSNSVQLWQLLTLILSKNA